MNKRSLASHALSLTAMALLAGCGGGDGGGSSTPPPPAPSPTAPSGLSYPSAQNLMAGVTMTPLSPTVSGNPTSYSVSGTLPVGISLNSTNGQISGTPTYATDGTYRVTASNSLGSTEYVLAV